jgi:predicted glycoside hydrolase/deacetylase ChbG (UPF0249 family)
MKLIINADDFGLTNGVTYGIYDAIKNGVVTSTTMLVNTPGSELAGKLVKDDDELNVGLHLNLSLGKPLTACESLVDENGNFIKPKKLKSDEQYDEKEIYRELEAQYIKFVSLTGKKPTHADSHLYSHQIFPKVRRQAKNLSDEVGIPLRQCNTKYYKEVYFEGRFKQKNEESMEVMKEKLKKLIIENCKRDYVELMVHPGYIDMELLEISSYNFHRVVEGAVLKSPEIKKYIEKNMVELISFTELGRYENG